jgi:hypothetical protein
MRISEMKMIRLKNTQMAAIVGILCGGSIVP